MSGQRPDLDLDLVPLAAAGALAIELGLVRRIGDRQSTGELPAVPAVPARKLTGIEDNRGHVRLRDAQLDPAAGERRAIE